MYLTMSSGRVIRSPGSCPATRFSVGTDGSYAAPGQYSNFSCFCCANRETLTAAKTRAALISRSPAPRGLRCPARRLRLLQILVVPPQVSLVPVAHIARAGDAVVLVGIDDELCIDAQAAQRLIHLLSALHRHVEVAL